MERTVTTYKITAKKVTGFNADSTPIITEHEYYLENPKLTEEKKEERIALALQRKYGKREMENTFINFASLEKVSEVKYKMPDETFMQLAEKIQTFPVPTEA